MTPEDAEQISVLFARIARVLRGEEQDLTGRGLVRIAVGRIERALGVKVRRVVAEERGVEG